MNTPRSYTTLHDHMVMYQQKATRGYQVVYSK